MPAESKPIPDPTKLTTEALTREIASIRELLFNEIAHRGRLTDAQFNALSQKLESEFKSVYIKFEGIVQQFMAVDQRTAEQKADTRLAVDAALSAAKDAVRLQTEASQLAQTKSETAFTKQIDGILLRIDQTVRIMDGQISDLKARLDRLEGNRSGVGATIGMFIAIAVAVVAIMTFIISNVD